MEDSGGIPGQDGPRGGVRDRGAVVETLWDRDGETPYQTRVKCGAFRIHIFWRGDRDPDMHDHPADFWTFPLVSYVEHYRRADGHEGQRVVSAFRLHRRRAEHMHRVLGAAGPLDFVQYRRPVVTLGWWGKKRREWGFRTSSGWVSWKAYVSTPGWSSADTTDLQASPGTRDENLAVSKSSESGEGDRASRADLGGDGFMAATESGEGH